MTQKQKLYDLCNQMVLVCDDFTARKGATVTYVVFRLSDTDAELITEGLLVNPAIPESGGPLDFVDLTPDQQQGVLLLKHGADLAKNIADQVNVFARRLKKLLLEQDDA